MKVQKVYLLHDTFFASLSLINQKSFDGKDNVKEVYALTEDKIIIQSTDNTFHYDSLEEALEVCSECNERRF